MRKYLSLPAAFAVCFCTACASREAAVSNTETETSAVTNISETAESGGDFLKPSDLSENDFEDEESRWCFARSKESENFILFWEKGFGDAPLDSQYHIDTDDLLEKAERFRSTNVNVLHMADPAHSRMQQYKMQIYLMYTDEWIAEGAGYDNMIGTLWISPSACSPAGSVVAHEVGHCFQYQVYCDQLLDGMPDDSRRGFRYGYEGSHGGNGFWEQCAQWAAFADYPDELTTCPEFEQWGETAHLSFEHEMSRYQSYWLPVYWTEKHGADTVSRIWHESEYPEDALSAYLRLFCGGDISVLNDELYDYAAHTAVFDYECVSAPPQDVYHTVLYDAGDGWQQIAYAYCPGEGGFNVIGLPAGNISVEFEALDPCSPLAADDPGIYHLGEDENGNFIEGGSVRKYNYSPVETGLSYGITAVMKDGTIHYEPCRRDKKSVLKFSAEDDTERVYLVVSGTAERLVPNPWDNDERTDIRMPYKIRVTADGKP